MLNLYDSSVSPVVPEIVQISARGYKNFDEIVVPWSRHQAVYGPTGVGKTNLFEMLGLLFGDRATLWQISDRAADHTGAEISAVVRSDAREFPMICATVDGTVGVSYENDTVAKFSGPRSSGTVSWTDAWPTLGLDPRLTEFMRQLSDQPAVRYRLASIEWFDDPLGRGRGGDYLERLDDHDAHYWSVVPGEFEFQRWHSRTLVMPPPVPEWLVNLAPTLPEVFAPLRLALSATDSRGQGSWVDVLELPPTSSSPVAVTWLAGGRSGGEIAFDLEEQLLRAQQPILELLTSVDERIGVTADNGQAPTEWDVRYTLMRQVGSRAEEFAGSVTDLPISVEDDSPSWILSGNHSHRYLAAGISGLSSGERAWLDLGLAVAGVLLEEAAARADLLVQRFIQAKPDAVDRILLELSRVLDMAGRPEGWWTEADVEAVLAAVDAHSPKLPSADEVRQIASGDLDEGHWVTEVMIRSNWIYRNAVYPSGRVLLTDEPERHLHASAQWAAAETLRELGTNYGVGIATHSHRFLGWPGWQHLHLYRSEEGILHHSFDPRELSAGDKVATRMGLGRGELLVWTRYVLVVEGKTDELVLTRLLGDRLRESGILILPMHGIDEVIQLAELKVLDVLVDVPIGVLADNTRRDQIRAIQDGKRTQPPTKEEMALADLLHRRQAAGRSTPDVHGLHRPDIIAYVDESAIRSFESGFPGWEIIVDDAGGEGASGAALKRSFEKFTNRPVTTELIDRYLSKSIELEREPHPRLTQLLDSIEKSLLKRRRAQF